MLNTKGLIIPERYYAKYSVRETEEAIKFVKDERKSDSGGNRQIYNDYE